MAEPDPVSRETVYELAANRRRGHLLELLLDVEYATVESLSRTLAAREQGIDPRAVSESEVDRVGIELVHDHLPRLADHDLLEFDARSGDVVTTDDIEAVGAFLDPDRDEPDGSLSDRSELSVLYSEPPAERFLAEDG